jgi:hypothetical protein
MVVNEGLVALYYLHWHQIVVVLGLSEYVQSRSKMAVQIAMVALHAASLSAEVIRKQ